MTWIKTIPFDEADDELKELLMKTRMSYPAEYGTPNPPTIPVDESIVDSHTLIPKALYHAMTAFASMMTPDLPLERRQHEMIATMVSDTNDCFY